MGHERIFRNKSLELLPEEIVLHHVIRMNNTQNTPGFAVAQLRSTFERNVNFRNIVIQFQIP